MLDTILHAQYNCNKVAIWYNRAMTQCTKTHNFKAILEAKGVRATEKRLFVLDLLHKHAPASADDLLLHAKGSMNRTTIYRALRALEEGAVVYRVDISPSKSMYELSTHHAHYVVCTHCGAHETLSTCALAPKEGEVLKNTRQFKSIEGHSLHFFGVCKKCA